MGAAVRDVDDKKRRDVVAVIDGVDVLDSSLNAARFMSLQMNDAPLPLARIWLYIASSRLVMPE